MIIRTPFFIHFVAAAVWILCLSTLSLFDGSSSLVQAFGSTPHIQYGQRSLQPNRSRKRIVLAGAPPGSEESFSIREAKYGDLKIVAELMVQSFYENQTNLLNYLWVVAELNRLQQNFPYDKVQHTMYVAVVGRGDFTRIVGFVDVDGRPSTLQQAPPRPYLSDLAVHVNWRRRGIARALIRKCEDKAESMGFDELHIRVEQHNEAAFGIYRALGYEKKLHEIFGVKDTTTLLRKRLQTADEYPRDQAASTVGRGWTEAVPAVADL